MQSRSLYVSYTRKQVRGGFVLTHAVNNFLLTPSEKAGVAHLPATPEENATLALGALFLYSGTGYMFEQGTKPGTISLVLMSNPLALLSWYGPCSAPLVCPIAEASANIHPGLAACTPRVTARPLSM